MYGIQYYRGVRQETGGVMDVAREYREFKRGVALLRSGEKGHASAWKTLNEGIREDHRDDPLLHGAVRRARRGRGRPATGEATSTFSLASDAVTQDRLPADDRVPRDALLPAGGPRPRRAVHVAVRSATRSRSDVHWDAELEPGVVIVHGFGLAISYAARVRGRMHPLPERDPRLRHRTRETKEGGAPLLERNVHVGIGATLYGPIVVGEGTKIMAGCVLSRRPATVHRRGTGAAGGLARPHARP